MRKWLKLQYQNMFLYVPFGLAGGAGVYFAYPTEPDVKLYFAGLLMAITSICIFIGKIPKLIRAILIFVFGFLYAMLYAHIINTPQIKQNIYDQEITGVVQKIDYTDKNARIYLNVSAKDIGAGRGSATVRLNTKGTKHIPQIGDTVSATIDLFRPTPVYVPETFDWAQWLYMNGISATGNIDNIKVIEHSRHTTIPYMRDKIHRVANSFLVDSLILGYKAAVPKADGQIWTVTGIGHVWSISGFHMTLVGGWLGFLFYMIFRSIPYVTRRIPARIPAMACAWCGLLFYLILSGIDVATVRSFLMATLVILAFVFGRSIISLRNIAIVFCVIFLMNPHYVMQAGFQLSFMAVWGLVWMFTVIKPKMPNNKLLKIIYACVLTSVVATVFTAPFVAAHFGAIPTYGLVGNLILLPVFSFAIMPLVITGTFTVLLGWSGPILWAHKIYDHLLSVAQWIANLPHANIAMPHIPNSAIVCIVIAFMCLTLIRTIKIHVNIILFAIFSILAVGIVAMESRPVFFVTYDGELAAGINKDGRLEFSKARASKHYFAFRTWKAAVGENPDTQNIRQKPNKGLFMFGNTAYMQKFVPVMNNITKLCMDDNVKHIVTYFDVQSKTCAHKLLRGGLVIYENGNIRYVPKNRLWHNLHE